MVRISGGLFPEIQENGKVYLFCVYSSSFLIQLCRLSYTRGTLPNRLRCDKNNVKLAYVQIVLLPIWRSGIGIWFVLTLQPFHFLTS